VLGSSIIACGWIQDVDGGRRFVSDSRVGKEDIAECPECSEESGHRIIKTANRGRGEDILVKCLECGHVHTLILRPPRGVKVKTTLSDGNRSSRVDIEVDEDEEISRGEMFEHDGMTWEVTRIDDSGSKERSVLNASEISSMWATRCDKTVIGVTMTEGEFSESGKLECEPDRVFSCGSILPMENGKWRIRAIHTGKGRTLNGSRRATEIKRIYLHRPD